MNKLIKPRSKGNIQNEQRWVKIIWNLKEREKNMEGSMKRYNGQKIRELETRENWALVSK